MKPAPATSVRAMSSLGGSAATIACRQLARVAARGLRQAQRDVGGEVAVLRIARALDVTAAAGGRSGRDPAGELGEAASSSCSSSCFKKRIRLGG